MEDKITKIFQKLEGLDRLETKLNTVTSKVSEDLDVIRDEISQINEERKEDNVEL